MQSTQNISPYQALVGTPATGFSDKVTCSCTPETLHGSEVANGFPCAAPLPSSTRGACITLESRTRAREELMSRYSRWPALLVRRFSSIVSNDGLPTLHFHTLRLLCTAQTRGQKGILSLQH